jgi:glutamate synthase (ferredoxin)
LIENHQKYTQSTKAAAVLQNWNTALPKFVKVMPRDYKRVLEAFKRVTAAGLSGEDAIMAAFEENAKDASRVGGG